MVRARAISISVILQQKQLVDLRVVKTARARLPMEFLAIATLALSPVASSFNISGIQKESGARLLLLMV